MVLTPVDTTFWAYTHILACPPNRIIINYGDSSATVRDTHRGTIAYAVRGDFTKPSLQDLRSIIERVEGHETGWPPWLVLSGEQTTYLLRNARVPPLEVLRSGQSRIYPWILLALTLFVGEAPELLGADGTLGIDGGLGDGA